MQIELNMAKKETKWWLCGRNKNDSTTGMCQMGLWGLLMGEAGNLKYVLCRMDNKYWERIG